MRRLPCILQPIALATGPAAWMPQHTTLQSTWYLYVTVASQNQLRRYHKREESFLTTHGHFYDGPSQREAPAPEFSTMPHKKSTHAKLYSGSPFYQKFLMDSTKGPTASRNTLVLFPEPPPHTRTIPSATYRGNGTFTVGCVLHVKRMPRHLALY